MNFKKSVKITLAALMTLALLVACIPAASAEDNVCKIGDTTYASVAEAIEAASDGAVIDVIADTYVSSKIVIDKKIELTSSNGSEISASVSCAFTIGTKPSVEGTVGEVTVSGNLKITSSKDAIFLINSGTLNVKDDVYLKTSVQYAIDSEAAGTVPVHINIYGGTIESTSSANDKGTIFFGGNASTITMTGGTLIQNQAESYGIKYRSENGNVTISGGQIKTKGSCIAVYDAFAGKQVNVTGGILESANTSVFKMYSKCDYLTVNVSGGILKSKKNTITVTSPMSTVNVTGGTIIATEDAPINMGYGTLNVSGGQFFLEGTKSDAVMMRSAYNETEFMTGTVNVTGGLFVNKNTANSALMSDYTTDTKPISFTGGTILFKDNVVDLKEQGDAVVKNAKATYENETYYVYNCFAGADKKYAGTMKADESIRFADGSTGLRFTADFSKSVVNALGAKGVATYGMLIVPVDYLTALDEFTVASLTEKYGADGFLNIACTSAQGLTANADGSVTLNAAIVNIKAENYGTAFAAVAYACVDGQYYYTSFDQNVSSASVKNVAAKALADATATYTEAQLAVLNGFAG